MAWLDHVPSTTSQFLSMNDDELRELDCYKATLVSQQIPLHTNICPSCSTNLSPLPFQKSYYKATSKLSPEPLMAICNACKTSFPSSLLNENALTKHRQLPVGLTSYLDRSNSILPVANPYDELQQEQVKSAISDILHDRQTHAYYHMSSCMKPSKRTHGKKVSNEFDDHALYWSLKKKKYSFI